MQITVLLHDTLWLLWWNGGYGTDFLEPGVTKAPCPISECLCYKENVERFVCEHVEAFLGPELKVQTIIGAAFKPFPISVHEFSPERGRLQNIIY